MLDKVLEYDILLLDRGYKLIDISRLSTSHKAQTRRGKK
jgi:hypothetical protein